MSYLESLSFSKLCELFFVYSKDYSLDKKSAQKIAGLWEYPSQISYRSEFELKLKKMDLPSKTNLKIKILGELFRRQLIKKNSEEIKLQTPQKIYERFNFITYFSTERLHLICVDNHYKMLKSKEVARGNAFQVGIHSLSILKEAIKYTAFGFFLIHNHPSGECRPSENDLLFTKKINQASKILGLKLIDHVILGEGFYSFKEQGLL